MADASRVDEIRASPAADKFLRMAENAIRQRVEKRLLELKAYPTDFRLSQQLVGRPGIRKSRIGDYRILFEIRETVLYVLDIGHRKEIYR